MYPGINQIRYICKYIEDKTVDTSFELVKSQTDKGEKNEKQQRGSHIVETKWNECVCVYARDKENEKRKTYPHDIHKHTHVFMCVRVYDDADAIE